MERRLGKEDARISAEEEILSTNSTAQGTKLNCGYSHHIYGAGGDERSGRCYTQRTWKSFSLLVLLSQAFSCPCLSPSSSFRLLFPFYGFGDSSHSSLSHSSPATWGRLLLSFLSLWAKKMNLRSEMECTRRMQKVRRRKSSKKESLGSTPLRGRKA